MFTSKLQKEVEIANDLLLLLIACLMQTFTAAGSYSDESLEEATTLIYVSFAVLCAVNVGYIVYVLAQYCIDKKRKN